MRRGRLRKLQAGLLLPWTTPPYGYRVDPDRPRDPSGVRPDGAKAAAVAEMFAWYAEEGRSLFGLAGKLRRDAVVPPRAGGIWNTTTVRGILTNPAYAGEVYAGRTQAGSRRPRPREDWIAVASVPAIVTRELFDRVQAKLARNRQFSGRNDTAHPYLLRALVGCGVCGLACFGRSMPRTTATTAAPASWRPCTRTGRRHVPRATSPPRDWRPWSGTTCATCWLTRRRSAGPWSGRMAGTGCRRSCRRVGRPSGAAKPASGGRSSA
jgi:hypothetical protein